MRYVPRARARAVGAWALAFAAAIVAIAVDARTRRLAHEPTHAVARAVVRVVGTPDLALSSSTRWLRHPSQAEPGAPFADGPATLDVDPGGAVVAPPVRILGAGARETSIRRAQGTR